MKYAELVINAIFDFLLGYYDKYNTLYRLSKYSRFYPTATIDFSDWLIKYSNIDEKIFTFERIKNLIEYLSVSYQDFKTLANQTPGLNPLYKKPISVLFKLSFDIHFAYKFITSPLL